MTEVDRSLIVITLVSKLSIVHDQICDVTQIRNETPTSSTHTPQCFIDLHTQGIYRLQLTSQKLQFCPTSLQLLSIMFGNDLHRLGETSLTGDLLTRSQMEFSFNAFIRPSSLSTL
jgi:hypothetical protein